jgi:hypothetical protein
VYPALGVTVKVVLEPWTTVCEAEIVPPAPALDVTVYDLRANAAVTLLEEEPIFKPEQVVPVQAPDQPEKLEFVEGLAVRSTKSSAAKVAEQVAPQFIPAGFEVTVPAPVPALETVRALAAQVEPFQVEPTAQFAVAESWSSRTPLL